MAATPDTDPGRKRSLMAIAGAILLALAMLFVMLGAHSWKRDLVIREVQAKGIKLLTAREVLALASIGPNERLYGLDVEAVRRRVETNPFVRSAAVVRDIPDRVTIEITERVPVAAVIAGRLLMVDDSAYVLPGLRSDQLFDLPVLTGALPVAQCEPGRTIRHPAVREALALLATARQAGDDLAHRISEVRIGADGAVVCYTADAGVPVMFGQGDWAAKLVKFDAFWKEHVAQRGVQELQYVDLRYDDQVVARWNPQQESLQNERKAH